MKAHFATATIIPFVTILMLQWTARAQPTRSVWDGVYTEEQALRGKNLYAQQCASCHSPDLTGGASGGDVAPPLAGSEFMTGWDGLTVGDLFDRIRISMPQDSPGSLSDQQSSDVLAFLLATNKLPAGTTELAKETMALKTITFAVKKSG
jgi:cytochrome c